MSAYSEAVLADSPTLYFRLDDSSGNFVDTANAHNATPSASIVSAPGLIARDSDAAARFDWAGALKQADTSFAIGGAPFTVECWVNLANLTLDPSSSGYFTSIGNPLLLGSSGAGSDGWTVGPITNGTQIAWSHHGVGTWYWSYAFSLSTTYHWVWVMTTSTNIDLYVNGAFQSSTTVSAMSAPTGGFVINNGVPGVNTNPRCATNALDEVAVYSSALSSARILVHYLLGAVAPLAGSNFERQGDRRS